MRLKVFKKFFFTTSCILLITLTLVFVILSFAVNNYIAGNKKRELIADCDTVAAMALEQDDGTDYTRSLLPVMRAVAGVNQNELFVTDQNGRVILCGCEDFHAYGSCSHSVTGVDPIFLDGVPSHGIFLLTDLSGRYEQARFLSVKRMISASDEPVGFVFASSELVSATEIFKMMFGMYAIAAIIPILFMFFAEYGLTYRLTKPLKYMSVAAQSIAKGDFTKRVPVMSDDEIGELSVLFNRMTDSLARTEATGRNFVANVSHELKTPMTTISGFIDGMIDGTIDENRREYYLKIVSDEVKRLSRLVQSMLNIAKLESNENALKPRRFDFADMVLNVVLSMEQKIDAGGFQIVGLDTLSHTMLDGDQDLLYQVVYNLTDNAVKYTPKGGEIGFALRRFENMLEFKVRNTGGGIPPEDIPHLFERFYKVDKSRSNHKGSLGLGLYICKTIVDLHGGSISVASQLNEYTEFTVVLPINLSEDSYGEHGTRI